MKIALFSDTHMGFEGKERENESFENARQCFELAMQNKVDAIVLGGDIFNVKHPSYEDFVKAMKVFSVAKKAKCGIKAIATTRAGSKELAPDGIPVIAIHGNHEFLGKDHTGILEIFDQAGYIAYLHASSLMLQNGNEKACLHLLGNVPEKKAKDALKLWDPKPASGCRNVLVLHQNFKEYAAIDDEMVASLSFEDLPQGFDLIVNGHLHWRDEQQLGNAKFILMGSTVCTQMKPIEAGQKKGLYIYESNTNETTFIPLLIQRNFYYHKLKFENAKFGEVLKPIESAIDSELLKENLLSPMIRIRLLGTLELGINPSDLNLESLLEKYRGRAILNISKDFTSASFRKKIAELRELHKSKQSISSLGLKILEKNLEEAKFGNAFDYEKVFELLSEDEIDKAIEMLSEGKISGRTS